MMNVGVADAGQRSLNANNILLAGHQHQHQITPMMARMMEAAAVLQNLSANAQFGSEHCLQPQLGQQQHNGGIAATGTPMMSSGVSVVQQRCQTLPNVSAFAQTGGEHRRQLPNVQQQLMQGMAASGIQMMTTTDAAAQQRRQSVPNISAMAQTGAQQFQQRIVRRW